MYGYIEIGGWIIHGIWQAVRLWAPFIDPLPEPSQPPAWWLDVWPWWVWLESLDGELRPTALWFELWFQGAWWQMHARTDQVATDAANLVKNLVLFLIGYIRAAYDSLGEWLETVHTLVGEYLPPWADDALEGLLTLYYWLPENIREGWIRWWEIWDSIVEEVRAWALDFYMQTVQWAHDVHEWLVQQGQDLTEWWTEVRVFLAAFNENPHAVVRTLLGEEWTWLVDFYNDPAGLVLALLDPWWPSLVVFAQDCLEFWYNLWGSHAERLADILEDPLGYLWDRAEAFIDSKLEG